MNATMKKELIYVILILFGGLIAFILLGDVFKNDLSKTSKNPYKYDLGDISDIDPSWIKYNETKRIAVSFSDPKVIDYYKGCLAIGYENQLQVIDTLGREHFKVSNYGPITSIAISPEGDIYIGCKTYIEKYNLNGIKLETWNHLDTSAYITSIAASGDLIFVADAGGAKIHQYDLNGEILHSFDGKNKTDSRHGFIIPSPYFDLDVDSQNQLWAANTGIQSIENYEDDGSLRAFWGNSSYDLSGFIGCCNPAQFTILSDDSFVTCEKGLVRIKVYHPSGELESIVATPDDFDVNSEPLDLTSDELNNIYALDITRKVIRKFERKDS